LTRCTTSWRLLLLLLTLLLLTLLLLTLPASG
jgi:hypothetical protein